MRHHLTIKYLLALLATILLALPQVAHCQEEEYEFEDPNQAEIDSLLNAIKPDSPDSVKANNYTKIASITASVDTTLKYAFLALDFCNESDIELKVECNKYISWGYYMNDQSRVAVPYAIKCVNLSKSIGYLDDISSFYLMLAKLYEDLNKFDSSNYYINLALEIATKNQDTVQISYCYRVLGDLFSNKTLYKEAEHYYWKAIALDSLIGDTLFIARDYSILGDFVVSRAENEEELYTAKEYLTKSVHLHELINSTDEYYKSSKYLAYGSLAELYIKMAYLTVNDTYADSCFYYIKKTLDYFIKQGRTDNAISDGYTYVKYLKYYKKYNEALTFLKRQKKYFDENTSSLSLRDYYSNLKEIYISLGDYKNAYECFEKETEYRNAHINDSSMNALADMKTDQAMMLEKIDRDNAEKLHAAEKRQMHIIIISLIGGLLLILLLVFYIFRMLGIKKKANSDLLEKNAILIEQKEEIQAQRDEIEGQKEEIENQRDEIMAQRDHIEAQSKEIQSSINYARRIQRALLTPDEAIGSVFPDYFILYKPRSVVSGDFYWVGQFGDNKVCIVADCTGHGVPGGFMSVLGMTNLNYIVSQELTPNSILNKLREAIISNLRQNNDESLSAHVLDGMDVAAYVMNERLMTLTFAGANNPLILIRDNEMQIIKPDKMPVGISAVMKPFQSVTVELHKGDCLYTFSDGFQDQFGYDSNRKFQKSRLRKLLLEIHQRPMDEQRELLNLVFKEWRGPADNQTDDVLIMGVRV